MNEVGIVQVEDGLGDLVHDVLLVPFLEVSGASIFANERVQVDIHMFEDEVYIFIVASTYGPFKRNDIGVLELAQKHHLAISPLRVCGVRKGIEVFLQGFDCFGLAIDDFPHVSVGPAPNLFDKLVQL
jgi:hypothetical protein